MKVNMECSQVLVFLAVVVDVNSKGNRCQDNDIRAITDISEHPYVVDIDGCAGTIIDKRWILTGAHCAYDKRNGKHHKIKSVRVGSHIGDKGRRVEVEASIEHPNFDVYNSIHYDFLLLKLRKPLKLGKRVGPAKLASSNPKDLLPGLTAITYGFGHACEESHHAIMSSPIRLTGEQVTVISREECRKTFHDVDLHQTVVCAKPAVNHCDESGGPLIVNGSVIGVASTVAEHECSSSDPIVFASVPLIRNWIHDNMNKSKSKPSEVEYKPSEVESKPSEVESKPSEDKSKLSEDDSTPAPEENDPTSNEGGTLDTYLGKLNSG